MKRMILIQSLVASVLMSGTVEACAQQGSTGASEPVSRTKATMENLESEKSLKEFEDSLRQLQNKFDEWFASCGKLDSTQTDTDFENFCKQATELHAQLQKIGPVLTESDLKKLEAYLMRLRDSDKLFYRLLEGRVDGDNDRDISIGKREQVQLFLNGHSPRLNGFDAVMHF